MDSIFSLEYIASINGMHLCRTAISVVRRTHPAVPVALGPGAFATIFQVSGFTQSAFDDRLRGLFHIYGCLPIRVPGYFIGVADQRSLGGNQTVAR